MNFDAFSYKMAMKEFDTIIGSDAAEAAHWLQQDELVAIPTETVYGLAANAFSPAAIRKVFAVKKRPASNPLIVHTHSVEQIEAWVQHFPETAKKLLQHFSPGPLTVLLPQLPILPSEVNGGRSTVAFRIPAHPLTLSLLQQLSFPLVAPSANLFGTISPTAPAHVLKNFKGVIPYILDGGPCTVGIESTVVGFDEDGRPVIYRQGAITADQIEAVAGSVMLKENAADKPAPGMLPYHYSPQTPLLIARTLPALIHVARIGYIRFKNYDPALPAEHQILLSPDGSLEEAARNLYKALHYFDEQSLDLIIAEPLPDEGLGGALNERLQKAAYQHQNKIPALCAISD
jgi:L-threonylcarbamoyladenylate synthase